jgi:spore coat protein U-like protein
MKKSGRNKPKEGIMKRYMIVLAVLLVVLGGVSGALAAQLTPTVTATGTVTDTCNTPTNGTITFTIDPSGAATLTPQTTDFGNTSPSVKCTNGQTYAVACTSAHSNQLTLGNDGTSDPIAYAITGCASPITGSGFVTATSIPLGLSIAPAAYQTAQIGAHIDTITVTITY